MSCLTTWSLLRLKKEYLEQFTSELLRRKEVIKREFARKEKERERKSLPNSPLIFLYFFFHFFLQLIKGDEITEAEINSLLIALEGANGEPSRLRFWLLFIIFHYFFSLRIFILLFYFFFPFFPQTHPFSP